MRRSVRHWTRPAFGTLKLPERSPLGRLARRAGLAVGMIVAVAVFLWLSRDGLRDGANPDRALTFADVFYFTIVTLTTIGYGDIVPYTPEARLANAILLTPIRLVLWAIFLGTAYELTFQRYRERINMDQLRERLSGHTIVCGYGVKGRAIVAELFAHGHKPDDIVIIDPIEDNASAAAASGLVALRGDASSEAVLGVAAVDKASHVLVATAKDDSAVLITLTVRDLAPRVRLVASAHEEENVKLLYRAGADVVVSPSVSGGRLMAAAVRQRAVPRFLEDLLAYGGGLDAAEHTVTPAEAGRQVAELPDLAGRLVLGVLRGETRLAYTRLADLPLEAGDVVVYLTGAEGEVGSRA